MLKYILITFVLLAFPCFANAQQDQDATRDLWDTAFMQKRPAGKATARKRVQPVVRYKVIGKRPVPSNTTLASVVGVTVWRLRPSKKTDDEEVRQIIHQQGEWTPERVTGGSPLTEGSRIQLTIESPRSGYLYIFNREMYADKTFGEPYLIFPTLRINGGDNKVSAGKIIEIPSADDKPPFYTLTRSRADHEGEALTVIVSEKPLDNLEIGRNAITVSADKFNSYESRWGAMTHQLELDKGAGKPMSKAERAAAAGKAPLTRSDPTPQTIYQVLAKPDQPLLLTIPLSIRATPDKEDRKSGS